MLNKELVRIFYEIADFLDMEGTAFKPQAYKKAALALESMQEEVSDLYKAGGRAALERIPGVGKGLSEKIEEYIKTGRIKYYQDLKKKTPLNVEELTRVEGLGPRKVKVLYEKLGVRNISDLEKAATAHKIAPLFGFGSKTEKNILEGLAFLKRSKGRFLLGEILPMVNEVKEKLEKLRQVEHVDYAGSIRRMKETIGDADFLVISKSPEKVMDFFVSLPGVLKIWGKGKTKASVRMKEGFDMDIRVVPKNVYGAALQYFTGSKEHNVVTRKIAIDKGLKLSEYGLFKGSNRVAGKTEQDIYKALDMTWIPPEIRENQGEVEAALEGELPKLIELKDIKGDLHTHSSWDGGANSIPDMARAAKSLGYEYIGISDHMFLKIEHGLNERQLDKRNKEIDKINSGFMVEGTGFRILKGCEANIMKDGSIDVKDEALAKLDYVIASIHSHFKMAKDEMTQRMIRAMKNPHVDIIAHPTGRLIKKREEYQIDLERVFRAAKETGTILEINAYPERLDLRDQNIRRAKELGIKMVINTDSHHKAQLRFMEFGVSQARRGWAEKEDIVNTWSLEKLLKCFKKA